VNINRITGSLLGLALGDAFGAPHEGGILERTLWVLLGTKKGKRRWTDDTQMTIDLIESLLRCGSVDQDDLARQFAQSYRWSRGYGPGAAKMLKRIRRGQSWESAGRSVFRDGSFGNGGAMRAPAVGLFYANDSQEELVKAACATAAVTHAHPHGQEGAVLIALATALALNGTNLLSIVEQLCQRAESPEFLGRLNKARVWLQAQDTVSPHKAAAELGNGIAALDSCVTAVYVALSFYHASFDELLMYSIKLHGDVDTIAAMAGAIWGAARGMDALPKSRLERLEQCDRLKTLGQRFSEAISHR
jgi:poly(ADP-ribose) glycohydrolase ARH3